MAQAKVFGVDTDFEHCPPLDVYHYCVDGLHVRVRCVFGMGPRGGLRTVTTCNGSCEHWRVVSEVECTPATLERLRFLCGKGEEHGSGGAC